MVSRFRNASLVLCALFLLTLGGVGGVHATDYIQVHSLVPPILKNYWANGMQFWAFGRDTVITDNYVQLTSTKPTAQGYLWNRHSAQLDAFELNVTVQMRSRDGAWFSPGGDSGFGIWYANDTKVNYLTDDTFFGFRSRFKGIGIVLDHSNVLHLVESDGSYSLNPTSMRTRQKGSCSIGSLGELHATITLFYEKRQLMLYYALHPNAEPEPADYANAVLCVKVNNLPLTSRYHFGVTAANSMSGQAVHNIHSVIMSPLSDSSMHQMEEQMVGQARLFEQDGGDDREGRGAD